MTPSIEPRERGPFSYLDVLSVRHPNGGYRGQALFVRKDGETFSLVQFREEFPIAQVPTALLSLAQPVSFEAFGEP